MPNVLTSAVLSRLAMSSLMVSRFVLSVAITEEYVLFGAVESATNYGKARFHMKRAAMALEKEFL